MNFGGPVWHASVSVVTDLALSDKTLWLAKGIAQEALQGVGNASLGEWSEIGQIAVHLRRRLAPHEQTRVGPAIDIRGTREATRRLNKVRGYLPRDWSE